MSKQVVLKIVGVVGLVGGCVFLYLSGVGENAVTGIVGAVFILAAAVSAVFGFGKK